MHIYLLPETNPCRNLAAEECLLQSRNDDILLLWRNANTIVIGRNQNTLEEINTAFAAEKGIRVVRRMSGGGAVYHDLENINFSFLTAAAGPGGEARMERFTQPVAQALRTLGVPAECSGRNDILANGRKISGNAQAILHQRLLHHGTLLFRVNGEMLERALTVRPEKLQSKAIRSVRSRVASISEFLPGMTAEAFMTALLGELSPGGKPEPLILTPAESALLKELKAKYASWEWTYGKNPAFSLIRTQKFPGGILEFRLEVRHGRIEDCAIFGDFMSLRDITPVCKALTGKRLCVSDLAAALDSFALPEYFGSITKDEILSCLCPETGAA